MTKKIKDLKKIIYFSILLAIMLILAATPLGFIQIGPFAITTMHIPVIVAAIILGWKYGATLGGIFGLLSMYIATTTITPTSFVFSPFIPIPGSEHGDIRAIIVAILPRILVGIMPTLIISLFKKNLLIKKTLGFAIAGLVGSLTNTILVLGLMGAFFGNQLGYHNLGAVLIMIAGVITSNGILEALFATLVSVALANAFVVSNEKIREIV